MTMDFDLNIVAIPAQPPPTKRAAKVKKNNKYEKRRQKAKKARQQQQSRGQQQQPQQQQEQDEINGDFTKRNVRSIPGASEQPQKELKQQQNEFPIGARDCAWNDDDNKGTKSPHEPATATCSDKPAKRTAEKKTSTNVEESLTESHSDITKQSRRRHSEQQPAVVGMTIANTKNKTTTGSKSCTKSTLSMDEEEERAEYMAEFHARPMELDRRSGARSNIVVFSKESSHIFDDTQESNWNSLGVHPRLIQTLQSPHFGNLQKPTTIQYRTIQAFQQSAPKSEGSLHRKNVLIHSETGSGKTLAYILPILQSLAFGDDHDPTEPTQRISRSQMGCRCIILCPTRELASQTLEVVARLCQANYAGSIVPGGLWGGDSRQSEKLRLRKGLAVIVATPGRFLDHLNKTQSLALSLKGKFQWLVLDEADRLLDMGLGDQVRQIVQWIRANEASKQHNSQPWWRSVLVSATVTPSVQSLAKERMLCGNQEWIWVKGDNEREKIPAASPGGTEVIVKQDRDDANHNRSDTTNLESSLSAENYSHSTPRQLVQFHLTVTAKLRLSSLVAFLVQLVSKKERVVVFMGTCAAVDYHYQLFNAVEQSLWDGSDDSKDDEESTKTPMGLFGKKARVYKLHGNVDHSKRVQTMKEFGASSGLQKGAAILLTTDVAARGLNLDSIDWTVQYDPPCEIADYVHRVGRGARAGRAGHSLLFLLPSERKYLEVLETKGIKNLNPLSLSSLLNQASKVCLEWTQAGVEQGGGGFVKKPQSSSELKNSRSGEFFCAEVQRRLEDCVVEDDVQTRKAWKEKQQLQRKQKDGKSCRNEGRKEGQLLSLARDAFLSFLRAYPTKKESVVRSIFSSRALHLGHVAKSFALKEPPKSVVSKSKGKKQQQQEEAQDMRANLPRSLEFGDTPGDLDDILSQIEKGKRNNIAGHDDDDHDEFRSRKRPKVKHSGKHGSAKALLLANAAKMQSNLMDAM